MWQARRLGRTQWSGTYTVDSVPVWPTASAATAPVGLGMALSGCLMATEPCEFSDAEVVKVPTEGVEAFLVWVETAMGPAADDTAPSEFGARCGPDEPTLATVYVRSRAEALEALGQTTVSTFSEWRRFLVPLASTEAALGFATHAEVQGSDDTPEVQDGRQLIFLVENCSFQLNTGSPQWVAFQ